MKTRRGRAFRNFSCEITIVKPLPTCPSTDFYECVSAAESVALERTLHVASGQTFALLRQ